MSHALEGTCLAFGLNDWMYNIALRDMPEDKATFKVDENTNEFRQIAAHILISRHMVSQVTEMGLEPLPWTNLGEGMEAGFATVSDFPALKDIQAQWQKIHASFMEKLTTVSDEILNRPSPMPIPGNPNGTVKEFISIIAVHESVHMGQLGLLLKAATGIAIMTMENAAAE